jgi:hypothetical protein
MMRIGLSKEKFFSCLLIFGIASAAYAQSPEPPRHRPPVSVPDLFNQEAAASDTAGIRKYSEDLVELIAPRETRKTDLKPFTNRLAQAEQVARTGRGKLVAEADVVRAFNELMKEVGAPPSIRTSESSLYRFREHAASIKIFPALFSADRNGTNCNPGEAVFLLYLLISDDGVLHEKNLDSEQILINQLMNQEGKQAREGSGFGVFSIEETPAASRLLSLYVSGHNHNTVTALFNHAAVILGF